ncbi:hypothetical protein Hanom_Chr01g00011191 [Helianthus anomalus]
MYYSIRDTNHIKYMNERDDHTRNHHQSFENSYEDHNHGGCRWWFATQVLVSIVT